MPFRKWRDKFSNYAREELKELSISTFQSSKTQKLPTQYRGHNPSIEDSILINIRHIMIILYQRCYQKSQETKNLLKEYLFVPSVNLCSKVLSKVSRWKSKSQRSQIQDILRVVILTTFILMSVKFTIKYLQMSSSIPSTLKIINVETLEVSTIELSQLNPHQKSKIISSQNELQIRIIQGLREQIEEKEDMQEVKEHKIQSQKARISQLEEIIRKLNSSSSWGIRQTINSVYKKLF